MRRWVALALSGALVMCAGSAANVRVEQAPEFSPPNGARVSVFGVFHDGHMSDQAWTTLSPKISGALGHAECEVGYGNRLRAADSELASSIDRAVRENGIDDSVLDKVAPSAAGDLVMVLMVYRNLPRSRDGGVVRTRTRTTGATPGRRYARPGVRYVPRPEDDHVFELSASLFSPKEHKLVAQVELRYTGDDLDEAMAEFTKKLKALVPGATCVGWNWPNPNEAEPDAAPPL